MSEDDTSPLSERSVAIAEARGKEARECDQCTTNNEKLLRSQARVAVLQRVAAKKRETKGSTKGGLQAVWLQAM